MPPKGYRHLSVKEEVYRRLEEFAERKGLSTVADALVVLLDYADIYSKIEYILQKGVSLPQPGVKEAQSDGAVQSCQPSVQPNISPNIQPNIAPSTDANAAQSTKAAKKERSGHVWCRKRASIRNLEAFVNWVKKTYGLVDWWESEGEVCFETLEAPEKSKGRSERKRRSEEGELEAEALE